MLCKCWHYERWSFIRHRMLEETLPSWRKPGHTGRVNAGKLGFAAAWRDTAPTIPVVLTSKENRSPGWIHAVPVLPADPLVPTLFVQGPKVRDTAARQTASGTEVCVTALLPSQVLCPEPAEPITASQESFPCLAFKVFRYLRTQRNKRNFNDTLSLVFPVTWKVLSTSENLTQH